MLFSKCRRHFRALHGNFTCGCRKTTPTFVKFECRRHFCTPTLRNTRLHGKLHVGVPKLRPHQEKSMYASFLYAYIIKTGCRRKIDVGTQNSRLQQNVGITFVRLYCGAGQIRA
jgi:hypothetical protein